PIQQREAFILHHGEGFDDRALAVAMDCSREAAANHLQAADAHLQAVAAEHFSALVKGMAQAYAHLAPDRHLVVAQSRRYARRGRTWRTVRRLARLALLLALLGALAY